MIKSLNAVMMASQVFTLKKYMKKKRSTYFLVHYAVQARENWRDRQMTGIYHA